MTCNTVIKKIETDVADLSDKVDEEVSEIKSTVAYINSPFLWLIHVGFYLITQCCCIRF